MKVRGFVGALSIAAAAALLAGCATRLAPLAQDDTQPPIGADHAGSWMLPEATAKTPALLYVAELYGNEVLVYNYKSGKLVGALTGLSAPGGLCVAAAGDVYVTDSSDGKVLEYAHGGTTPLKTWATNGNALGCSVDKANDLAVTSSYDSSDIADVVIFPKGGSKGTRYTHKACSSVMWEPGYDDKGNLFVQGAYSGSAICALLRGASKMVTLSYNVHIAEPGSVMWDGKYITLTDRGEFSGHTVIEQASLSGTTLTEVGETMLSDNCYKTYGIVQAPFIVGKKNTPVNTKQGTVIVGHNSSCSDSGVSAWHYPKGNDPFRSIGTSEVSNGAYAQAVSFQSDGSKGASR